MPFYCKNQIAEVGGSFDRRRLSLKLRLKFESYPLKHLRLSSFHFLIVKAYFEKSVKICLIFKIFISLESW